MNITKESIDALNAVVKIEISEVDYKEKVAKVLKDYSKNSTIPGFRKGHIPMGMVKKQYGKSVMIDEVNKLIADAIGKYDAEHRTTMQANFSAILYLLSEQQALIGRLLQAFLEINILGVQHIAKITDIDDGEDGLTPMYTQMYKRFAGYYLRTKGLLDQQIILAGAKEANEGEQENE